MDWSAEIGCEGGPVLVANWPDFMEWPGAAPFPVERRGELLFYSPFTRELPPEFLVNGDVGHVLLGSENPASLRNDLIDACLHRFPGSTVDRSSETWVLVRPDGKKLHTSLEPASEYALAMRQLGQEGTYAYGAGRKCDFWSVEPSLVLVKVSRSHSELLLAQVYYADSDDDVAGAYEHACVQVTAGNSSAQYRVADGPVAAVWSPQGACDLASAFDADCLEAGAPGASLDLVTAESGAAVWLRPGVSAASATSSIGSFNG